MLRRYAEGINFIVHSLCLTPLALLLWDFWFQRLGPHPVYSLSRSTGYWALVLLLLCLAVTPLQRISAQNWVFSWRRSFGLYAFFYACIHLLIFALLDTASSAIIEKILERQYTLAGIAALLLLLPLAITSTKSSQRRLKRKWRAIHLLVFPAAALALLHFFLLVKADVTEPRNFTIVFAVLLFLRIPAVSRLLRTKRK